MGAAGQPRLRQLALHHVEWRARLALLLDRGGDRGDLERRRAAAAADQARAELPRVRCELREVLGRRVRVDDAAAAQAREADVRQRGERRAAVAAHRLERGERGVQPRAMVGSDRSKVQRSQALGGLGGGHARERLGAFVEGQSRDDRERRDSAYGLDRRLELVQLVERFDHEEVDAAPVQEQRLLGEDLAALIGRNRGQIAQRADRPGDEDLPAGDLPCLARELHACAVDPLELVLEVLLGQFPPVCAERVRLDQVGPGADEARVQGDDALRRADVRLLGAAESRHGARDQYPHAAVGDDDRPAV